MAIFTKQYHPPGTAPGTLSDLETTESIEYRISLINFSDTYFEEIKVDKVEKCRAFLKQPEITWIHIQGQPTPQILHEFATLFEIHPLALEDIHNTGQRPKIESYDNQLFTIINLPIFVDDSIISEQISIFAGSDYVISFHMSEKDSFEPIRKRLRKHSGKIRSRNVDYLLYSLLDIIIDEGFPVLETFGEKIDTLEEELLEKPTNNTLKKLHNLKRELLILRRMLWPHRDLLNKLLRDESNLINDDTTIYLRDCYDHTVQIMDLMETYRDMTASMLDLYLSSISYKLNDVMRVLTVISTIFIPLTFIVGVYGMNFSVNTKSSWAMPELHWEYGYPILWIFMSGIALGMLIFFKRKGWF